MLLSNCTNSIIERLHYLSVYKICSKCYQIMLSEIWKSLEIISIISISKPRGSIKIIFNLLIIDHTYHSLISALPTMCKKYNWSACTYGIVFQIISKHFLLKPLVAWNCVLYYSVLLRKDFLPCQRTLRLDNIRYTLTGDKRI